LQVSGLRLTYNVSQPVGSRLIEAYARCADCRVPQYNLLDDEKPYWVVLNTYLVKGGDGFDMVPKNALGNRNTDELDIDIIIRYAKKLSPVTTGLEGRIKIVSSRDQKQPFVEDSSLITEVSNTQLGGSNGEEEEEESTIVAEVTTKSILGNILPGMSGDNIMDTLSSGVEVIHTELENVGEKLKNLPGKIPIIGKR